MTDEVRVVNEATGAEKGSKLARFDLVPAGPLKLLAEHYGRGARKYEDRNWERGYNWSLSFAALNRHLWAFWGGEDIDEETGSPHMVAVAWHAFTLLQFMEQHPELDDRPNSPARDLAKLLEKPELQKLIEDVRGLDGFAEVAEQIAQAGGLAFDPVRRLTDGPS